MAGGGAGGEAAAGEGARRRKRAERGRGLARSHQRDLNGASRPRPSQRPVSARARADWPACRLTGGPNRSAFLSIRIKHTFSLFCNGSPQSWY